MYIFSEDRTGSHVVPFGMILSEGKLLGIIIHIPARYIVSQINEVQNVTEPNFQMGTAYSLKFQQQKAHLYLYN